MRVGRVGVVRREEVRLRWADEGVVKKEAMNEG